jgi:hypothetical protein
VCASLAGGALDGCFVGNAYASNVHFLPVVHSDTSKFMELEPAEFAIAVLLLEAVNLSCGDLQCFHLWALGRREG